MLRIQLIVVKIYFLFQLLCSLLISTLPVFIYKSSLYFNGLVTIGK